MATVRTAEGPFRSNVVTYGIPVNRVSLLLSFCAATAAASGCSESWASKEPVQAAIGAPAANGSDPTLSAKLAPYIECMNKVDGPLRRLNKEYRTQGPGEAPLARENNAKGDLVRCCALAAMQLAATS